MYMVTLARNQFTFENESKHKKVLHLLNDTPLSFFDLQCTARWTSRTVRVSRSRTRTRTVWPAMAAAARVAPGSGPAAVAWSVPPGIT